MERMTIHRALSELKVLGDRIKKAIDDVIPVGTSQAGKAVDGRYTHDEFAKKAIASIHSVESLIDRKSKIKAAIVAKNAVTNVEIAGATMTIADAITEKANVQLEQEYIATLKKKLSRALTSVETHNKKVDENALQLASVALQKQNVKIGDDDVKAVTEPYLQANRLELVDPIGLENYIEKLEARLSAFTAEVDAVLSEINATTFIEF